MAPAALCKIDTIQPVFTSSGRPVAPSAVDSLTHEGLHLEFQSVAPSAADIVSQDALSSMDPSTPVSLPQGKVTFVAPSAVDSLTHEELHLRLSSVADVACQLAHVDLNSQVSPGLLISAGDLPHVITPESRSTFSDNNSPMATKGATNTRKTGLHTFALGASDRVKVSVT